MATVRLIEIMLCAKLLFYQITLLILF